MQHRIARAFSPGLLALSLIFTPVAPAFAQLGGVQSPPATPTVTSMTNESADGQLEYGTSDNYGSTSSLNTMFALTHSAELSNLTPNTTYHYRVLSRDVAGNLTTGNDDTFTTSALPTVNSS